MRFVLKRDTGDCYYVGPEPHDSYDGPEVTTDIQRARVFSLQLDRGKIVVSPDSLPDRDRSGNDWVITPVKFELV